jgi:ribonuclease P protein component
VPSFIFPAMHQFTYPKEEHLKSRKAIDQLFKAGQSFFVFPYKVVYKLVGNEERVMDDAERKTAANASAAKADYKSTFVHWPLQAGFAVSTKNFKKAVERNRIKRLGRETYRLNKLPLLEVLTENHLQLQVFFIYTDKQLPQWQLLQPKMQACLKKLVHLTKKHHEKLLQG